MIGSDVEHGKTNGDKPKEIIRYNVQLHGRWTPNFDRSDEKKNIHAEIEIKCFGYKWTN